MQILQKICCSDGRYYSKQETISKIGFMSYFYVLKHYFYISKQFPVCYIHKIEPNEKFVYLKFLLMDLKEIKINFKKAENSQSNIILPPGKYDLKYSISQSVVSNSDEYILSEGDRFIIFKFSWTDDDDDVQSNLSDQYNSNSNLKQKKVFKYFKFIMSVEYPRTEPVDIDYEMEIKFRIR